MTNRFSARLSLRIKTVLALSALVLTAQASLAAVPGNIDSDRMPKVLELNYSWRGLFPMVPTEKFALTFVKNSHFQAVGKHEESGAQKKAPWSVDGKIEHEYIMEVMMAVEEAKWKPVAKAAQVLDHTDDYPSTSLSFASPDNQAVRLFTTSNTETGAPWNIEVGGKIYSSDSEDIGTAVYDLLEQIRKLPHKP